MAGSPVVGGDFSAARNKAVADSLASVVDTAVMALLPRDALVRQFKTIGEALSGKAGQFIQEYKVLTESMTGTEYRVFIEAVVWTDRIRRHLFEAGIAEARRQLPKILLLIAETPPEGGEPLLIRPETPGAFSSFTEAGVHEVLVEKGYSVLHPDWKASGLAALFPAPAKNISDADVLEWGKRLGAEVVIFGIGTTAFKEAASDTPAPDTAQGGIVKARALRVDTMEAIAETEQTASAAHAEPSVSRSEALKSAGRLAGDQLAEAIARNWAEKESAVISVALQVRGTEHLGNFVTFRRVLVGLSGVKQMQIEEIRGDEAVIRVAFQGSPEALADALAGIVSESFEVLILEVTPDRILLKLSHREAETETPTAESR